jgi:hypothetical protein
MSELAKLRLKFPWPTVLPSVSEISSHGWLSFSMREMLSRYLSANTQVVVELGSWLGLSTRYILEHAPATYLIAIDHWQGTDELRQGCPDILPVLYDSFIKNCWNYAERIVPVRASTTVGLKLISDEGILVDLVYIDADHSYDSVVADLDLACELFPLAEIVGDDWDRDDVQQAAIDVARKHRYRVDVTGTSWHIIKSTHPQGSVQRTTGIHTA